MRSNNIVRSNLPVSLADTLLLRARPALLAVMLTGLAACGVLETNRAPERSAPAPRISASAKPAPSVTAAATPAPNVSAGSAAVSSSAATAPEAAPSASGYEIGPEDLLEINVWKEDGLKKEVLVRPDGGISFPLIGEVQAGGKTPRALQEEIAQRLSRFIPRAAVSVAVLKTASYKVYVIGRVNKPGEFTVGRRVDVLQALSMAGGLTPFAKAGEITVLRKVNGRDARYRFDYNEVQRGVDLRQNIPLRSGDTVVVP
jgi:polysaccharide biosynthesis/export protein